MKTDGARMLELRQLVGRNLAYTQRHSRGGEQPRNGVPRLNEPQAAHVMVEPLLKFMGWGLPDDPDSLWREYPMPNGGQVDYACRVGAAVKITVECKNLHVDLRDHKAVSQATTYGFVVDAPLSVLTDGIVWGLYSTKADGLPVDKLVRKIDLRRNTPEQIAAFFHLWDKPAASSGRLNITKGDISGRPPKQASTGRRRKRKNTRVTINAPAFRNHIAIAEQAIGELLAPVANSRNTFRTQSGKVVRFFASAAKDNGGWFNFQADHLAADWLFLAVDGVAHGWLIPASAVSGYLRPTADVENGVVPKSLTARMRIEGDEAFLHRSRHDPFPITHHRAGHA